MYLNKFLPSIVFISSSKEKATVSAHKCCLGCLKHVLHESAGQAGYPWAWWLPSWRGWHTSLCPRTNPPGTPQQPPAAPVLHDSGTSNLSAIWPPQKKNQKKIISVINSPQDIPDYRTYNLYNSSNFTLKSWAISRTRRWKGNFRIRSSVLFWYFRISLFIE